MDYEEHKARHQLLHKKLDELVADFIAHGRAGENLPSEVSVMQLIEWSYEQTKNPIPINEDK